MRRSPWFEKNAGRAESAAAFLSTIGIATGVTFTQTYSTGDTTIAAPTAVAPDAATAAALTENSTTIGGTQDGDFDTLAVAWNGATDPTAAEGTLLIDAIRECAAQINALIADNASMRTQITALVADNLDLRQGLTSVIDALQTAGIVD